MNYILEGELTHMSKEELLKRLEEKFWGEEVSSVGIKKVLEDAFECGKRITEVQMCKPQLNEEQITQRLERVEDRVACIEKGIIKKIAFKIDDKVGDFLFYPRAYD